MHVELTSRGILCVYLEFTLVPIKQHVFQELENKIGKTFEQLLVKWDLKNITLYDKVTYKILSITYINFKSICSCSKIYFESDSKNDL